MVASSDEQLSLLFILKEIMLLKIACKLMSEPSGIIYCLVIILHTDAVGRKQKLKNRFSCGILMQNQVNYFLALE